MIKHPQNGLASYFSILTLFGKKPIFSEMCTSGKKVRIFRHGPFLHATTL